MAFGISGQTAAPKDIVLQKRLDYDQNGTLLYIGVANPGSLESEPVWRISKLTYNQQNNLNMILWAHGTMRFDNVWDDRASFSYS